VTTGDVQALVAVGVLVVLAGFFGAAQTALGRMSLPRAERLLADERRGAPRVVALLQDPARTLNILALLVLVVQVIGVALLTMVVSRYLHGGLAVLVAAVVGSAALFVLAEVAPKTVALQHTDAVACATALWVRVFARPLSPLATVLIGLGNLIAPGRGLEHGPFLMTEDELREMIDVAESDEIIEESERVMIHSIFELGDTVVREIMVPRPDMVMVSADASLQEVLDVILGAGHSRVPVYRDDRDRIIGLIYAKDVLRRLHTNGDESGPWHDLLRPATFVPELKQVNELLRELQAAKVHLAIVVDEYGTTAGLVTIEDILEEIVGEIVDEYDVERPLVESVPDGGLRIDARLPIDELEKLLDCHLPDEEWDTVGGLLFGLLGHVPEPGEHVDVDGVRLIAEQVTGRRIGRVLVERVEPAPAEVPDGDR
jgi:CBS domain containing-hemolysin-like protein